MEETKESVLRVLEAAKARCAQAVLNGQMSIEEYARHTGMRGDGLREQIIREAGADFHLACKVLRAKGAELTDKTYAKLAAAGIDSETIRHILGQPELAEGSVREADWQKILDESREE